jgi:hypothetical protein
VVVSIHSAYNFLFYLKSRVLKFRKGFQKFWKRFFHLYFGLSKCLCPLESYTNFGNIPSCNLCTCYFPHSPYNLIELFQYVTTFGLLTVTELSEACTVFARLEAGIVGSNPTQGMDVWYVCLLCVFVFLATSWSSVQGVLPSV